jgi:hypothetical protein
MYRPDGEPFQVLTELLVGFADDVRKDEATPVVLVFPNEDDIAAARDGQSKSHASLPRALDDRGVPTIDLTDPLGEQARHTELGALLRPGGHYSPLGNRVVAMVLADRLPSLVDTTCGQ